jgi:hypothetical protein
MVEAVPEAPPAAAMATVKELVLSGQQRQRHRVANEVHVAGRQVKCHKRVMQRKPD